MKFKATQHRVTYINCINKYVKILFFVYAKTINPFYIPVTTFYMTVTDHYMTVMTFYITVSDRYIREKCFYTTETA